MLTRLDRITKRAKDDHTATFNNLYTLLTYDLLWLAFRKLKRDKAPGRHSAVCEELSLRDTIRAAARTTRRTPPGG